MSSITLRGEATKCAGEFFFLDFPDLSVNELWMVGVVAHMLSNAVPYLPYLYNNSVATAAMDVGSAVLSNHPVGALLKGAGYVSRAYQMSQAKDTYHRSRRYQRRRMPFRSRYRYLRTMRRRSFRSFHRPSRRFFRS